MGVLMVAFACCRATATAGDDQVLSRHRRGLVLRSWRGVQHQHQSDDSDERITLPKIVEPILPSSRDAMVLAGLPISMKLVLLQRLTGYDKRTPNGKAFLGMRGKKNSILAAEEDAIQEELNAPDSSGSSELNEYDADVFAQVPEKKKMHSEKFLGMRGKKMADSSTLGANNQGERLANYRERYLYQQPMADLMGKKRAPSSHSFMGMRGKRSARASRLENDRQEETEVETQPDSETVPRYQERLANHSY